MALGDHVLHPKSGGGIPGPFSPTLSPTNGSTNETKTFVLAGKKAAVVHELHYRPVPYPTAHELPTHVRRSLTLSQRFRAV